MHKIFYLQNKVMKLIKFAFYCKQMDLTGLIGNTYYSLMGFPNKNHQ